MLQKKNEGILFSAEIRVVGSYTDRLLRMPKLQEIFTTVAIVCHCYERLAALKNVFTIILLWARKYVEKLFEETVYKWDEEKKK